MQIAGGSTRIPASKQIIQDVFGITASTSLNTDEGDQLYMYRASLNENASGIDEEETLKKN